MAHPSSPEFTAAPGDLTVPLTTGWQGLAAGVLLLVVTAVLVLAVATARTGASERSDWQAWLAARPSRRTGDDDPWAEPAPAGTDSPPGPLTGH